MSRRKGKHVRPAGRGLEMESFYAWDGDTLVLNILGHPSAKRDVIGKAKGHQLNVSVAAAPKSGNATGHMVLFLAGKFGVRANGIEVVFGRKNVNKQIRIKAPKSLPPVIARRERKAKA